MEGTNTGMNQFRAAVAVILAMVMLLLVGCNDAVTAEEAIQKFNVKMNNCDYKGAFAYVSEYDGLSFDRGDKDGTKKIVDAVARTLEIDVIDIQTAGATGMARLRVTTVDLRKVYGDFRQQVIPAQVRHFLSRFRLQALPDLRHRAVADPDIQVLPERVSIKYDSFD